MKHRDAGVDAPGIEQYIASEVDIDLLFVIQNVSSMTDKQTVLAANFPRLVAALDAFPAGRPNLHIGFISTTVDIGVTGYGPGCPSPVPNDDGLLQNTPRVAGCSPPTGRYITDIKNSTGGRTTNYAGTLDQAMSCIAQLGDTGCGFRAPLEAMKRALDNTRPQNAGFLRNNALLAVVIVGDEDDCSTTPSFFALPENRPGAGNLGCVADGYTCDQAVSTTTAGTYTGCAATAGATASVHDPAAYFAFLETIKPPGEIVIATISGDLSTTFSTEMLSGGLVVQPSCTATINGNPASADPGIRIADFASLAAAGRSRHDTICQGDYSAALTAIGQLLYDNTSPCILGAINTTDTDPGNPGVQLSCIVADVVGSTRTPLPACTMSSPTTVDPSSPVPCWWAEANATACVDTDSHFEIFVQRVTPPPPSSVTEFRCN